MRDGGIGDLLMSVMSFYTKTNESLPIRCLCRLKTNVYPDSGVFSAKHINVKDTV